MRRVRHRRDILSSNVIGSRNYTQDQYNAILDVAIDDIAQFISSEDLMIAISKWLSNEDFSDFIRANFYDEVYEMLEDYGKNPEDWF